ncbi:hypothetical protein GCT13_25055 [Paraburkholderia sp. CNPSo 3157]|uniref:Uncharacterized protein n=1 Tax=Paraburkholderia franconis TaxID=2654983 RepID=A0A7X1NEI9_9BURK|nr:hypothetical protein [Paraburkholderia franconis]MPW20071.1 hypothetical protein [Paraburkholderia franconis]
MINKPILLIIAVLLAGIAASLVYLVHDRQVHNAQEEAAYQDHLKFKAGLLGITPQQLEQEEKADGSEAGERAAAAAAVGH